MDAAFQDIAQALGVPPSAVLIITRLIAIVLILLGTSIVIRLAAPLIRRVLAPRGDRLLDETRARTLQPLTESIIRYLVYFIALIMVLREINIDATAILASAGVLGLAIGFGAQNLVRDILSGFFLLFEGTIQVGDVVTIAEHSGLVERIGIRTTQIRKYSGELWTIPNGQIQMFGNANRDFMRAIVEVGIGYAGHLERAMAVMQKVGEAWVAEHPDIALGPPEVQGVVEFRDIAITIRLAIKVKPLEHWAAERELRKRIKLAFDQEAEAIPFPGGVVYPYPRPDSGEKRTAKEAPKR